ncbi:unnamed protein product [Blepharisma stoltei]|uniref:Serine hydrolase domain-containing protein n=1 Tax=Blepharisma stoltei TaxID=1481888 RepID=A0AAU9KDM5_9CILI|nr:unnamed protein product [Blepharisma stoltei]
MKLNSLVFPAPKSTYDISTFKGELVWIPQLKSKALSPIPCLYCQPPSSSSQILIYFHGNLEDLGACYLLADFISKKLKINVLAVEYPGYGIYPGKSSSKRIKNDAKNIYEYLQENIKIKESDIIILGRSIGSGPATFIAAKKNPGALVLMSAYTSIKDVAKKITCCAAFLKNRFKNTHVMNKVVCPTLLIHGKKDTLIPWKFSEKLRKLCGGPATLALSPAMTHNDFNFTEIITLLYDFLMHYQVINISDMPGINLSEIIIHDTHEDSQEKSS